MKDYRIIPISAFTDNYIWLLQDNKTNNAWVVDPGDAVPVIKTLEQYQLQLQGILITHHHWDHTAGISGLLEYNKNIPVYGSHISSNPLITHYVKENDVINIDFTQLTIMEIPGHTLDHIAFYNKEVLFSGDTLFSFGCGKVFEGTPTQMYHSLEKLSQLADNILLYCGHEYTLANLKFTELVDPHHSLIKEKIHSVMTTRQKNIPSLPSTLHVEKHLNPFLRCTNTSIVSSTENHFKKKLNHPEEIFAHLREWKNSL